MGKDYIPSDRVDKARLCSAQASRQHIQDLLLVKTDELCGCALKTHVLHVEVSSCLCMYTCTVCVHDRVHKKKKLYLPNLTMQLAFS